MARKPIMTRAELRQLFPNAKEPFLRANASDAVIAVARVDKPAPVRNRLRQNTGPKMNKTEEAFFEYLKATMPDCDYTHYAQSITLLIANGCRYTPDFISVSKLTGEWLAHETKGFMRDDAGVKIKVAASVYPAIKFRLVTKRKGGQWDIQEILP